MMAMRTTRLTILMALAASGCTTAGKLEIRPVGQQAADTAAAGLGRIAMARSHLLLGNVALALEEFRRAEREQPGSALALAGMAECYERMGRGDLSRRYYEEALAAAPREPVLYQAMAASLERQGHTEEPLALRREAASLATSAPATTVAAGGSIAELPIRTAPASSVTPIKSVTIALSPPRPVTSPMRLERLSTGEVALVSRGKSLWTPRTIAVSARSVTIRFEGRPVMVVLNAARVARLAARTRDFLSARGFARAQVGDAPSIRRHTLIRYPHAARAEAERIAAQFPFSPRLERREGPLTLVMGRDAGASRNRLGG